MKFCVFTDPHLNRYPSKKEEFRQFIKKISLVVDGFICSGDWCSNDVDELDEIFKIVREETDKPVLTVFGNHDFWNISRKYTLDEVISLQIDLCQKYNITHLEQTPFENENLFICGFDGWYAQDTGTSVTNDYDFIPKSNSLGGTPFQFLKRKEMNAIYKAIDYEISPNKKKVCVTHFGFGRLVNIKSELVDMKSDMVVIGQDNQEINLEDIHASDPEKAYDQYNAHKRHAIIIAEKFDLVIFGHSHRITDFKIGSCSFMNVGADYNKSPESFYKIIDL